MPDSFTLSIMFLMIDIKKLQDWNALSSKNTCTCNDNIVTLCNQFPKWSDDKSHK